MAIINANYRPKIRETKQKKKNRKYSVNQMNMKNIHFLLLHTSVQHFTSCATCMLHVVLLYRNVWYMCHMFNMLYSCCIKHDTFYNFIFDFFLFILFIPRYLALHEFKNEFKRIKLKIYYVSDKGYKNSNDSKGNCTLAIDILGK